MALSTASGTFAGPGSTGTQAITGVGFLPKALILWANGNGGTGDIDFGIGFASSTTARGAMGLQEDSGETTTLARQDFSDDDILHVRRHGGALNGVADLDSFDSDGFTLDWTTAFSSSENVNYFAIAGTDLTDAAVVNFTKKTSTGTDAITGVGFEGDVVLFMGNTGVTAETIEDHFGFFIGAAKSSTERWVTSGWEESAAADSNTGRAQRTDACILSCDEVGTIVAEADFTSMDSDGFTVNYSTADGVASDYFALVLKGGSYDVGSFNGATSTGNQAVTGVGFAPDAEFVTLFEEATSGSIETEYLLMIGASLSSTDRRLLWISSQDDRSSSDSSHLESVTRILLDFIPGDTSPALAEADFVSQDSDGFTWNWSTVDAIAREVLYLAMADAPAVGGLSIPVAMDSYRRRRV